MEPAVIALLIVSDGRLDYLRKCISSAAEQLIGPITERWLYDDTGDEGHRERLKVEYPQFIHINGGPRQGFGGAISASWAALLKHSDARFVAHIEQDFVIDRPVDLSAMARVLDRNRHLVQLALRRQPWNDEERAAGGIVEQHPNDYQEVTDGECSWLEHRRFFTTNPSLYRASLCAEPWPEGANSEGRFTHQLLADPTVRFGYWGERQSGEWCTHIGHERVGTGY